MNILVVGSTNLDLIVTVDEFPKSGEFVIGGFCVRILQKDTIEQARRFANAVGALTATKKGAQPSLLTKAEVDELMATK